MDRILYRLADGPQLLMWLCLAAVAGLAWAALGYADASGILAALCGRLPAPPLAILAMWLAMALAMMLPAAAPMVAAYMDIARAARAKGIATAAPSLLIAGYLTVWAVFAVAMTALQFAAQTLALDPARAGAGFLILAGLYQFAPMKHACLTKCRRPMPYFLGRWSDQPFAVFRMGVEQGALCLGCCWAMMLLSLGLGAMNLAWMAALSAVMILKKTLPEPKPLVYGLGIGFIAAGFSLALGGIAWP